MQLYLKLLIILLALSKVRSDCQFTTDQVKNETRLVAIDKNGILGILQEEKVPVGTDLHFFCTGKRSVHVTCNRNGTFSRRLPFKDCSNPPKLSVEPIADTNCKYDAYMIGYRLPNVFLIVYYNCFNSTAQNVLMTSHEVYPSSIVTDRPAIGFSRDFIKSIVFQSYQAKNVFAMFNQIFGSGQKYVTSETDIVINRGHLTPSADFLFPIYMRATFRLVNVVPMFSSINRGNWKSIESWVRRFINRTGKVRIMTGVLQLLSLQDGNGISHNIYLGNNTYNPIPKWIFKTVLNNHGNYVFLTYNNIYENTRPEPVCQEVQCPLQLQNDKRSGFTYCCDPSHFELNILPNIN